MTESAADRLARVVELCPDPGPFGVAVYGDRVDVQSDDFKFDAALTVTGDMSPDERRAYANWVAACLNCLRDDAPALLAEFQALRSEHELTLAALCKQGDELFAMRERLQVAMETKADYDKLRAELRNYSLRLCALREALPRSHVEIEETFLAHHGAGTGDSNEPC